MIIIVAGRRYWRRCARDKENQTHFDATNARAVVTVLSSHQAEVLGSVALLLASAK